MSMKKLRRRAAQELKGIGLPFVLRQSLGKATARGDAHAYVMQIKGFRRVARWGCDVGRWGCDCSDSEHTEVWEGVFQGKTYRITTEWGRVELCERI